MRDFFQIRNVPKTKIATRKKHLFISLFIIFGLVFWIYYAMARLTVSITGMGETIEIIAGLGFLVGLPLVVLLLIYVVILNFLLIKTEIYKK